MIHLQFIKQYLTPVIESHEHFLSSMLCQKLQINQLTPSLNKSSWYLDFLFFLFTFSIFEADF